MVNESFTGILASDAWTISIIARDINGNRRVIVFASREDLLRDLPDMITEHDEILLVMWGEIMLYNALGVAPDHVVYADDLASFFG